MEATVHRILVGVFVSPDRGDTWLPVHAAGPDDPRVVLVSPHPYEPLKVLASTDAAVHWYQISDCQVLERWFVSDNPSDRITAIEACDTLSDGGRLRYAARAAAAGFSANLPEGK
jgi:hypothetical protein